MAKKQLKNLPDFKKYFNDSNDDGICNIIQGSYKFEDINDANGNIIKSDYAPINLVLTNFDLDTDKQLNFHCIPFLFKGYNEVVYGNNGEEPQYNKQDFISRLPYARNIKLNKFFDITKFYRGNFKNEKPKKHFLDRNTKNYIRVEYTIKKDAPIDDRLQKYQNKYQEQFDILETITKEKDAYYKLLNFKNNYNLTDFNSYIKALQKFLDLKTEAIYFANVISNEGTTKFGQYIAAQLKNNDNFTNICIDLIHQVQSLDTAVKTVVNQIKLLNGQGDHTYSNLINLEEYQIIFQPIIELDVTTNLSLELLITDINRQINDYVPIYKRLLSLQSEIPPAVSKKTSLINFYEYVSNLVEYQYSIIKPDLLNYIIEHSKKDDGTYIQSYNELYSQLSDSNGATKNWYNLTNTFKYYYDINYSYLTNLNLLTFSNDFYNDYKQNISEEVADSIREKIKNAHDFAENVNNEVTEIWNHFQSNDTLSAWYGAIGIIQGYETNAASLYECYNNQWPGQFKDLYMTYYNNWYWNTFKMPFVDEYKNFDYYRFYSRSTTHKLPENIEGGIITLADNDIQEAIAIYGSSAVQQKVEAVNNMNNALTSYLERAKILNDKIFDSKVTSSSYCDLYYDFQNQLYNLTTYITDTNIPKYEILNNKIIAYVNNNFNYYSTLTLKQFINDLYYKILYGVFYFDKDNILQVTPIDFNSRLDACNKNILMYKYYIQCFEDMQFLREKNADGSIKKICLFHPIVFRFDDTKSNNITGDQNGGKTIINDNKTITSPQAGTGKTQVGKFTGMVLGTETDVSSGHKVNTTGLLGYYKGKQSVKIDASSGIAIFGISKIEYRLNTTEDGNEIKSQIKGGQIIIDPSTEKSLLYSSNYWKEYDENTGLPKNYNMGNPDDAKDFGNRNNQGICLFLSDGNINLGEKNAKIWSGKHDQLNSAYTGFYLDNNGFSIGSRFYVSSGSKSNIPSDPEGGVVRIGYNATHGGDDEDGAHYWELGVQKGTKTSYIGYNTTTLEIKDKYDEITKPDGKQKWVYLGTDGISIGAKAFTRDIIDEEGKIQKVNYADDILHLCVNGGHGTLRLSEEKSAIQASSGSLLNIKSYVESEANTMIANALSSGGSIFTAINTKADHGTYNFTVDLETGEGSITI